MIIFCLFILCKDSVYLPLYTETCYSLTVSKTAEQATVSDFGGSRIKRGFDERESIHFKDLRFKVFS